MGLIVRLGLSTPNHVEDCSTREGAKPVLSFAGVRHERRWPSVAASLVIHGMAILLLPVGMDLADFESATKRSLRSAAQPVIIRVPRHLLLAKAKVKDSDRSSDAHLYKEKRPITKAKSEYRGSSNASGVKESSSSIRVAKIKGLEQRDAQLILLQPHDDLLLRPDLSVMPPSAMFWSEGVRPPTPKAFVDPGHREPSTSPSLAEQARLDVPSQTPSERSNLAISTLPTTTTPALPVAAGSALPVQLQQRPAASTSGTSTIDLVRGDQVALLSISPVSIVREMIEVPAGNIMPPGLSAQSVQPPQASPVRGGDRPEQPVMDRIPSTTADSRSFIRQAGAAPAPVAGQPPATATNNPRKPEFAENAVNGSSSMNPQGSVSRRLEHPPDGKFDVIIVQTSLADLLPESSSMMSGRPVSTVYLEVGDSKEWLLHYCAVDTRATQSGSVVKLGDPRPISPPYPKVTLLPAHIPPARGKFIYIHGFIDENGLLQRLRIVGEQPNQSELFLGLLAQWQFRPARRGNDAATVEVMFAVPARRT
jgi:hypothetical protein